MAKDLRKMNNRKRGAGRERKEMAERDREVANEEEGRGGKKGKIGGDEFIGCG